LWYIDFGANQHMSPLMQLFRSYTVLDSPRTILLGDNSSYQAVGLGSILLQLPTKQTLYISDVLFVPGLVKNLISVAQITRTGHTTVIFTQSQCIIATKSPALKKQTHYRLNKTDNMFILGIGVEPFDSADTTMTSQLPDSNTTKWHH